MITEKHKVLTHSHPLLITKTILACDQALSGLAEVRGCEGEGWKESLLSRLINLNTYLPPRMGCWILIGWFVIRRWCNAPPREFSLLPFSSRRASAPRRASSLAKTVLKIFFFSWVSGSLGWGHWNWQDTCVSSAYVRHSRFGTGSHNLRSNLGLPRL